MAIPSTECRRSACGEELMAEMEGKVEDKVDEEKEKQK
jgi:hypothetical protein